MNNNIDNANNQLNNIKYQIANLNQLNEIVKLYDDQLSTVKNRKEYIDISKTIVALDNNIIIGVTSYKILNKKELIKEIGIKNNNHENIQFNSYLYHLENKKYGFLHGLAVNDNYKKLGIGTYLNNLRTEKLSNEVNDIYGLLWSSGNAYNIIKANGFEVLHNSLNHWYLPYDINNYCKFCGDRCYCNAIIVYKN